MDYFQQATSLSLFGAEQLIKEAQGVTLCESNSDRESNFSNGTLVLTSHRLFWKDMASVVLLSVDLKLIKSVTEDRNRSAEGFPRLCITFFQDLKMLKMVFANYGSQLFLSYFSDTLQRRRWEIPEVDGTASASMVSAASGSLSGLGISAVQRKLESERKSTDATLQAAFADIEKLMGSAQEMVSLSRKLADRIREGQGAISADETVEFKSVLLSMGIANPVTRQTSGKETKYHRELSAQLAQFLSPVLKQENGHTMSLADVYCRFNRARGVDLVSPDDVLVACEQFQTLNLPVALRRFESGVLVVQLREVDEESVVGETMQLMQTVECLSPEQLSRLLNVSVTLAKERLLLCEQRGSLCRDDNVEGLKFYHNKFLLLSS